MREKYKQMSPLQPLLDFDTWVSTSTLEPNQESHKSETDLDTVCLMTSDRLVARSVISVVRVSKEWQEFKDDKILEKSLIQIGKRVCVSSETWGKAQMRCDFRVN